MTVLHVEYNYWALTRRYVSLPRNCIMTTREIARLLGTSSPGVTIRMKKYRVLPEVWVTNGTKKMHKWKTNDIIAAAQLEWGQHGHLAPVSSLKAEQLIAHVQMLRKDQTLKEIAANTGIGANVISKWLQRESTPSIAQHRALLVKYPMLY